MPLNTINEIYATLNESPVITIQFTGEDFETLSYVLGNEDKQIGNTLFEKSNFQLSLPESGNSGFSDVKISLCNVNNEVFSHLQTALNNRIVLSVKIDLRIPETLVSDWEIKLDVKGVVFQDDKVQITASANDILNCEFPKLRYTAQNFPGLKYIK